MKIIQSFWSKPSIENSEDPNSRFQGGWLSQKYAFFSHAFSLLTFNKFYSNNVELYTDVEGKKLLIDLLELPYSKVYTPLNELDKYNSKLWAIGKLYTYNCQSEPFVHVDTDVYIWDKLPEKLVTANIFAQNIEENFPAYSEALEETLKNFDWIPASLINILYRHKKIMAFNAGIIGGTNLDFFKEFYNTAIEFIDKNLQHLDKLDIGIFNTIYEQQLGYALAEKADIKIEYMFRGMGSDFSQVINFQLVPFGSNFVHCIGYAKKSIFACEQLEARLAYHFPEYYEHIIGKLNAHFNTNNFDSTISESRLESLFQMYQWLEGKSLEDIFNAKFVLNPQCQIEESDEGLQIQYFSSQNDMREKKSLKEWDLIVLYFKEGFTSIKELHAELSEDESFMKDLKDANELKERLVAFVMDKAMLLEWLIPDHDEKNSKLSISLADTSF